VPKVELWAASSVCLRAALTAAYLVSMSAALLAVHLEVARAEQKE
jgi:hypothetical protein